MGLTAKLRDEILAEIPALCLLSGNAESLIGIGQARMVAQWLGERGFPIIGLEGFTTDGVRVFPMPDFVADFSSVAPREDRAVELAKVAASVLSQWSVQVEFVDFTLDVP